MVFMRLKLYEAGPAESYAAERHTASADRLLFDSKDLFKTVDIVADSGSEDSSFMTVLPIEVAGGGWGGVFLTPPQKRIWGRHPGPPPPPAAPGPRPLAPLLPAFSSFRPRPAPRPR